MATNTGTSRPVSDVSANRAKKVIKESGNSAVPQGTALQGTVPQGTVPQGTVPQGTVPQGTAPLETAFEDPALAQDLDVALTAHWNEVPLQAGLERMKLRPLQTPAVEPFDEERFFLQRDTRNDRGFTLGLRGFNMDSYPDASTFNGPGKDPKAQSMVSSFDNLAVSLMYRINGYYAFGVELGQETFPQSYNGIVDGESTRWQQNPRVLWLTANYRHRFEAIFDVQELRPFADIGVGGTEHSWLMTRSNAGIAYSPFGNVEFRLGLEGSLLLYRYQGTWFTTTKIGVLYGMALNF